MHNKFFLNNLMLSDLAFAYTYVAASDKYPMRNKGRSHNGLLYTIKGTETYHFRDRSIEAVPGSVLYIPKGEQYTITLQGEESVVITVDFEIDGTPARPFRTDFSENNTIKSYFQDLEMMWERKKSYYLPECKSHFYKIIATLSRQISHTEESTRSEVVKTAERYMRANYLKKDFRIEELAEITGISLRYFETLFQKEYHVTPKAYILYLKTERAKELLLSEKLLIKDIAVMLGYSDIYHFGKIFKAKTGYTPSEYRSTHVM